MHALRLRTWFLVCCVAAVLTVACGQGSPLYSPTGPTGAAGATALTADEGADVAAAASTDGEFSALDKGGDRHDGDRGRGDREEEDTNEGGHSPDADNDEHGPDNPGRSHEDKVVGFVSATGTNSLTVNGITINVTATTVIRHGHRTLLLADIEIGDHVQARGTMNADETILTATEIKVEDTGNDNDDDDDDDTELRGTVSDLTGTASCSTATPALTFKIGTTTIKTNGTTEFDDVTCATLANGNIVELEGTQQLDGSILAGEVELESGPDEVEGTVAGLTGTASCGTATPSLTFTIGATTVTTSVSTAFSGVTCATLANGMHVEVEGTLGGTTLAAASVEKK